MDPQYWKKTTNSSNTSHKYISNQKLTVKFNRIQVITYRRDNQNLRTNLQENRFIFNQIRQIKAISGKLTSLTTKPPTPDHIDDLVKSPLKAELCDSIFTNYEERERYTTSSAPFIRSLISPETKILPPRISFRVKTTNIDNKYDLYSITCTYVS